jgi:two-component system, cell cycle sensor histidine kinase PleC
MFDRALQQLRVIATSAGMMLALSVLVPAGLLALAGWWTYRANVEAAYLDARNTVDILYEDAAHSVEEEVVLLHILRDEFDQPGADAAAWAAPAMRQKIKDFVKFYPQVTSAVIFDRKGDPLFVSLDPTSAQGNIADRDYFRDLAAADKPIEVGPSYTGRVTGREIFNLTLRRNAPDGTFNGIIGVSVATDHFRDLFARIAARRPSIVMLSRTDGAVVSRLPAPLPGTHDLPATAPLLVNLQKADAGSFIAAPFRGGDESIFAYRSLAGYPLVIAYGISRASVLAAWWSNFVVIAAIGIAASLGLVATSLAVIRSQTALRLREGRLEAEIGRRREAEAETRRSLEEALRANTAKSGFLAMMSHELRTPLNAIIGFSEMMTSELFGPLGSDRYRSYVADIAQSGTHLLKVINDILDLSRLDLGRLKPDVDLTDILGVLEQTVRMVTPIASKAGVVIALVAAPGLPGAPADARLLKQALLNVLSNAIKFTPEGGSIHVLAKYLPDRSVVVEIRDTGIGMTADQIQMALEPFVQVDNSLHRKYEGAGLGLPLAKAFIELQGGRFEIESKAGRGTVIRFVLVSTLSAAGWALGTGSTSS